MNKKGEEDLSDNNPLALSDSVSISLALRVGHAYEY